MSRTVSLVLGTGVALLGAGVAGLGALLDEGAPRWPGAGAPPAAWPEAATLGQAHLLAGAALALGLLLALLAAAWRSRGLLRGLWSLAALDTLLLAASGAALAPGGWREGGLPAGLDPWIAAGLIEAAAATHAASALALPLLIALAGLAGGAAAWLRRGPGPAAAG